MPIKEFNYQKILEGMELTNEQFIDLCILLGCDYCDSIKGIGPKKAITLIKEHKTIEAILENIDREKYIVPEDWPFARARQLFITPEVTDPAEIELEWKEPDEEGIIQYMCNEKGFA